MARRWSREGFTLIELIMVIVILGILAAVAIPRFVDLQAIARRAAANSELGALRSGATVYYASAAAHGPSAAYPATKAALTSLMSNPLTILDPINANFGWAYASATGRVSQSGTWP